MDGDLELDDLQQLDAEALLSREWLVTNGLGGYASGTLPGPPTRKHHGVFVPNLVKPAGRHVLVSQLVACLTTHEGVVELGGARGEDGQVTARGDARLVRFALEAGMPVWEYVAGGLRVRKRVVMPHRQNLVCIEYEVLEAPSEEPVHLQLRPFYTLRRHDEEPGIEVAARAECTGRLAGQRPVLDVRMFDTPVTVRVTLLGAPATLRLAPDHRRHLYSQERDRGYPHFETHYSPGCFDAEVMAGQRVAVLIMLAPQDASHIDPSQLFEGERTRVRRLLEQAGLPRDPLAARLVIAADQFIVEPANRAEEQLRAEAAGGHACTVIAGYHWFGDWGRDTMISLEGLTLCTGRHAEAAAILATFAGYVKDGLLPNLFPEGAREALYHTVDATLWYFHALDRYLAWTGDLNLVGKLMPVLESVCRHYRVGTHFGIGVDPRDGLVRAGAPGYQLTWMDAKAGDWVVTPRRGKPVEIQALWFNALRLMSQWRARLGLPPGDYDALADQVRASFNARFWNPAVGCLRDVVDAEHGGDDDSGRPNQILALSLEHPVLDESRWQPVLDYVTRHLLTPYGLRTLAPDHPDYKRNYHGDLLTRDGAYHQGTVWPWLIGHYVDALLRAYPGDSVPDVLEAFNDHLREFGVGTIAEIFDAEPPFQPRGCIAQAWSVAEVLRARLRYSSGRRSSAR